MLNLCTFQGRMVREPEKRYTPSGTAVASFTLAIDRDFKDANGEKKTDFIDFIAFKATADFIASYFTKGSMAVVSGRLQIREWQDKEGNKRRTAEVVADNVYFGEQKRDGNQSGTRPAGNPLNVNNDEPRGSAFSELDNGDGDLPF